MRHFSVILLVLPQLFFCSTAAVVSGNKEMNKEIHQQLYWELCGANENGEGGTFCFKAKEVCFDDKCYCRKGRKTENDNHCGTDINECEEESTCDTTNGVCVNKHPDDGFYQCTCKRGYTGVEEGDNGPTTCIAESSCYFDSTVCHGENTECVKMSENQYECQCQSGYGGNGIFCQPASAIANCNKNCNDKKTMWMTGRNKSCHHMKEKVFLRKCNNNKLWNKKRWCELRCFNVGRGYDGDVCCNKE